MRKFFVTPFLIEGSDVAGALYSDTLQIELASLRNSQSAAFRHRDPAYLFPKEVRDAVNLNKDFLFLGHNFTQYGHFILETLPMLTALLESKDVSGFFLPWGSRDDLLYSSLALLDIDSSRVYVHREKSVVTSRFRIIDRPIVINNSLVSMSSYYPVVARLKEKAVHSSKSRLPKKIFLDRKPDRVSIEIYERVASFFVKNGFTRIRPEQYSLLEQVRIFSLANDVASFPGFDFSYSLKDIFLNFLSPSHPPQQGCEGEDHPSRVALTPQFQAAQQVPAGGQAAGGMQFGEGGQHGLPLGREQGRAGGEGCDIGGGPATVRAAQAAPQPCQTGTGP